jgi:hypothetical protein
MEEAPLEIVYPFTPSVTVSSYLQTLQTSRVVLEATL